MAQYILLPLLPLFASFATAQSITTGPLPTGYASMQQDSRYATQRSCVQHCLWYNGPLPRGHYYNDWDDVGKTLKCGASPQNFCYCATSYSTSATSYFSTCIAGYCGTDDPNDLISALSIYNAYCQTANGNPEKPVPTPEPQEVSTTTSDPETEPTSGAETSEPTTGPGASTTSRNPSDTAEGSNVSETNAPPPTETEKASGGLAKGTLIGIAVGASVGAIMLIAIIVLSYCLIKKKQTAEKEPMMGGIQHYS